MSKTKYTTNRIIAQALFAVFGSGAIFGAIWLVCRIAAALLALAGVA